MDNKKTSRRRAAMPSRRRLIQLYSALLHNAYLKGFITGRIYQGKAKYACVPGFNCYSCPGAVGACPLGAIQNALASAGHRAGWYVLGIVLLFGVALGRTVCGWLCPLGLIQELLQKIPVPRIKRSRVTAALAWLKYVILIVFVLALPLWYGLRYDLPLPAFCKYICPAGTLEGAAGHLAHPSNADMYGMLGVLFTRKWVIMLVIGLACVFCYRSFCRFLCPLGAIYGLFNRFSVVGVRIDEGLCTGCGSCVAHCDMDVRMIGDRECIQCGKCMDVCPHGAISLKAGGHTVLRPGQAQSGGGKRRKVLWGTSLAVLCLALLWFNVLDPSNVNVQAPAAAVTADAPAGNEPGCILPDFSVACYDGSIFTLSETMGKPVFINLWATYCTPCKAELPYFSDLYQLHRDDIVMLAVHPSLVTDDPKAYLEGRDYAMPFATDPDGDPVCRAVGFTGTLPQTIVLDRRGVVIYNGFGSVTREMLDALYEQAARQPQ